MQRVQIRTYQHAHPVSAEDVLELSEEKALLAQGQTARCRLQPLTIRARLTEGLWQISCTAEKTLTAPVSLSFIEEVEAGEEAFVFMPATAYNGNRQPSLKIPYPPYAAGGAEKITDIPRLPDKLQLLSGDMSTPAMGVYQRESHQGLLLLGHAMENGRYTGWAVRQEAAKLSLRISTPGVREDHVYFFGSRPDGTGFYPCTDMPSPDEGILLSAGESLTLTVKRHACEAPDIFSFYREFNAVREDLEHGVREDTVPFSHAFSCIEQKTLVVNQAPEGYLMVGDGHTIPACWQAGWVGGGMNTLPLLMVGTPRAREEARRTILFITKKLQRPDGWYIPMFAGGTAYGDCFSDTSRPVLLVRKDADLLYFLLKQAFYQKEHDLLVEGEEESIRRQADAFVSLYQREGEFGQFLDMDTGKLLQRGTLSAAIAPAALCLAYLYFGDRAYLDCAREAAHQYAEAFRRQGFTNGGPGEILQAPDSESAFGLVESLTKLFQTTGEKEWLSLAQDAFDYAVTWCVSYDFPFPSWSEAAHLGAHTIGTVFANAQNKHSAPGICTLSAETLWQLYRATKDEKYVKWAVRISHALPQFVSRPDRPVMTLEGRNLPSGYMNERVQMSDWEGPETVGGFLYGSNWPETTMALTYAEVPGVYADLEAGKVYAFDHVEASLAGEEDVKGHGFPDACRLRLYNPTPYEAYVRVYAEKDTSRALPVWRAGKLMQTVHLAGGETKILKIPVQG